MTARTLAASRRRAELTQSEGKRRTLRNALRQERDQEDAKDA